MSLFHSILFCVCFFLLFLLGLHKNAVNVMKIEFSSESDIWSFCIFCCFILTIFYSTLPWTVWKCAERTILWQILVYLFIPCTFLFEKNSFLFLVTVFLLVFVLKFMNKWLRQLASGKSFCAFWMNKKIERNYNVYVNCQCKIELKMWIQFIFVFSTCLRIIVFSYLLEKHSSSQVKHQLSLVFDIEILYLLNHIFTYFFFPQFKPNRKIFKHPIVGFDVC